MSEEPPICSQCRQAPAMYVVQGFPLCLNCRSRQLRDDLAVGAHLAELTNFASRQVEISLGYPPGYMGRVEVQQPNVVHTGDVNLQNISLSNSVVGAVNTGTVERLDVSLSEIKMGGDAELGEALARLAQAVLDSELPGDEKNDLIDQTSFVAEQARLPTPNRNRGALKATLASIRDTAATVAAISSAWKAIEPLLNALI
jgi:hypothetical protein